MLPTWRIDISAVWAPKGSVCPEGNLDCGDTAATSGSPCGSAAADPLPNVEDAHRLIGDRLKAGLRALIPSIEVRFLVPEQG